MWHGNTIYQPTLRTAIHRCDRLELALFPRGSLSMVFTALRSIATTNRRQKRHRPAMRIAAHKRKGPERIVLAGPPLGLSEPLSAVNRRGASQAPSTPSLTSTHKWLFRVSCGLHEALRGSRAASRRPDGRGGGH